MPGKTFAVVGATGHIGLVLSETLLQKGHKVRALGRSAEKLLGLKAKGAETLSPAADDAAALESAFRGADGVFLMLPPGYGEKDLSAFQDRVGEAQARAVRASGVGHVVLLSSVGAELPSGTGPIAGLHRQEQRLAGLPGVNVLNLRPVAFMENQFFAIPLIKAMGFNGSTAPGDVPLPAVATRDIALRAADFLDKLSFQGNGVFDLAGPKDYTLTEVTAVLGRAIGKPDLAYKQLGYEDARKGMVNAGMPPSSADLMVEMYKAGAEGRLRPTQPLEGEHRGKTTFEDFAPDFVQAYGG